jgi:L-threonylcarbamoyladenylate synthase
MGVFDGVMQRTNHPEVAARALRDGWLAVLPTETVYGLGVRADLPRSVARVYAAKGRPADHPLIVHVLDASAIDDSAPGSWGRDVPEYAKALAAAFWPGPLTLVVPRTARAGDFVTGGQDTVAIRVPAHPLMRAVLASLCDLLDDPHAGVAAPSANRFGRVSPTTAAHVHDELGAVLLEDDVLLDGGPSSVGVESTIVDCTGPLPVILRPGEVSAGDVTAATGLAVAEHSTVRAPGTLVSHYSPRASVVIVDADEVSAPVGHAKVASIGLLALDAVATPEGVVRLSAPETSADYARVMYSALREADELGLATVLVVAPPPEGIGAAVIDRLTRAAAIT